MARKQHELDGQLVVSWNLRYPVGTRVRVLRMDGESVDTVTVGPARLMDQTGTPVVGLDGLGVYLLRRVRALEVQE